MKRLSVTICISIVALLVAGAVALVAQEKRACAISVKCERPDAQVYLDGRRRGRAPLVIGPVEAGLHQLVVVAPGMEAFVRTVRVEPGKTVQINAVLVSLSGGITVSTDPPSTAVLIDGREVGFSPVDIERVPAGVHAIEAVRLGFETRRKEVKVEYGEVLSIFLRMRRKETKFSIYSFPSAADVYLDGKKVGITPLELKNVPPGRHALRVIKEEGLAHEEEVLVQLGKDIALDITLPVPGAIIELDKGPAGRKLYVDGHHFDDIKTGKLCVPPGEHTLAIRGWKGSLLHPPWSLKLEKGQTYQLSFAPVFKLAGQLKGHQRPVLSIAFAPDGGKLASASKDGIVRFWDAKRQNELFAIKAHQPGVQALAFGPEGKRVLTGGWDKTVRIWNFSDGKKLEEYEVRSPVVAVAWSPDGRFMAAGCTDGSITLWSTTAQAESSRTFRGHNDALSSLEFNPEGNMLISGGTDGRVIMWDASDGSHVETIIESSPVKAVEISSDGSLLATGCEDGQIRIRSLSNLGSVHVLRAQPHWVLSLSRAWGSVFAAGGDAESVTILDARAGKLLSLEELESPATALAVSSTGRYLAAGSSGGVIYLWVAE